MGLLTALWFILPAYVANGGACLLHNKWPVDGGRKAWDGNRLIGDGVTWGGLLSGTVFAIIFSLIQYALYQNFLDYYPIAQATVYEAVALGTLLALAIGVFTAFAQEWVARMRAETEGEAAEAQA